MSRILVLNSFGPMGSTLLAALIEKMQFVNVPLRKMGLHQYLMGTLPIDSGFMQQRLKEILESHSEPGLRGGVSVIDRNGQEPKPLVDINRVRDAVEKLKLKTPESIQDLYLSCRNLYCDAVTYKDMTNHSDWHIELTVDIHCYDPEILFQRYRENFDDVRMIHLHRPFSNWINSLASQAFLHPELKNRVKFFPHMRYNDYILYERMVAKMPGLHISFDEIFDTPIEALALKIANFLDVPPPQTDLRQENYDLYGKFQPYDIAFTRFDDKITFLQKTTLDYFSEQIAAHGLQKPLPRMMAWLRYLADMQAYRVRMQPQT